MSIQGTLCRSKHDIDGRPQPDLTEEADASSSGLLGHAGDEADSTAAAGDRGLFQNLLKSAGLYSLAMIAQRSVSILLLPLYTRYLSRADYGVLELLDLVTNIASLIVGLRLGQALFYYFHHAEDDAERGRFATTALIGSVLLGVTSGALGLVLAVPISRLALGSPQYADLVRISFLSFAGSLPVEIGLCYLRVCDRARAYAVASVVRMVANVAMNIVFLAVMGLGVSAMLWSSVITTTCLAAYLGWVIVSANGASFHAPTLLRMAGYSLPLGIGALGEFFLHFGDRVFLRGSVSLSDIGLYGLAYKLGMVVPYVATPFFAYWNAQMVGIVQRPGGESTYARVATYLLLGFTAVVLMLTVFIDPLLAVLVEPDFRGAAAFVPWIALAYLIRGMGSYWSNTFLLVRRPALVARVTWMGAGACLLGYALLVPLYRLWGAVAATMLGFVVMAAFALWKSQRIRPFRYEYGRWGKMLGSAAVAALPAVLLHPAGFGPQVALGMACLALFVALLEVVRFAAEGERRAARAALRRLFHRS